MVRGLVASLLLPGLALGGCPFLESQGVGKSSSHLIPPHPIPSSSLENNPPRKPTEDEILYRRALAELDLDAVKADIQTLLHTSQDWWPADFGNYGPFFVRQAWHCSGSYRTSDGRGGCDGGRQRFDPEQSWEDNTNLDKARQLLWPIKEKYGLALSWGDLFILTGNVAIEDMGGPILGFCAGRMDDPDGSASSPLGPTQIQETVYPCDVNGNCTYPVGSTTVGLIYLNPEGPMGQPIPEETAPQIRDAFNRMGMNDTETVALIGGGHAFGKSHGACPLGAGPNPHQDPENPWPGNCGTGKGNDTYTSGFEGSWTETPTSFTNNFFKNLLEYEWVKHIGPGGHYQWKPNMTNPPNIMMLTSDVSLLYDATYLKLVQQFADDFDQFSNQFAAAWYKVTSRDMGPYTRCMGDEVPPPQTFQFPLPPPPSKLPNFDKVKKDILAVINTPNDAILPMDSTGSYGPLFVRLAWQCANTFRQTDYLGGCNGARIRYSPQKDWTNNVALDSAIELLNGVKEKYGDDLTWADLIVLSGNVAIENAISLAGYSYTVPFTGGRSDAISTEPPTPSYLESPLTGGQSDDTVDVMRDVMSMMGLTNRQYVALIGGGHSMGQMHYDRSGFMNGSWTTKPAVFDNEYFSNMFDLTYSPMGLDENHQEYETVLSSGASLYMLTTDMNLRFDPQYKAIAQEYAADVTLLYSEFINAWTKIMNADLFGIETDDDSKGKGSSDNDDDEVNVTQGGVIGLSVGVTVLFVGCVVGSFFYGKSKRGSKDKEDLLVPRD
jgi:catalase-peroxidase